ncbi:MAG: hypothetical protein B1H11_08665 [Desulfobacteraceae bacterium 4484_190.1]|nr:MAG: hypothetical protein B1H11_08665 [Desulfobacteraceae bacterium 4484_190.1]
MEIICENCKTKLKIPDEKIPKGQQQVAVNCPKCKNKVILKIEGAKKESSVPEIEKKSGKEKAGTNKPKFDEDEDISLDFYEHDATLALVMEDSAEQAEKIKPDIEQFGYNVVLAKNTRDAIGRMRLYHFDLIILSEQFDGIDVGKGPILQYLNHLSMSVRRRIFIALIGNNFQTADHMTAFAMSVNLVVNREDMDRLMDILINSIAEKEKFYKVFMDSLSEAGKV